MRYLAIPLREDDRTEGVFVVGHFVQPERDDIDSVIRVAALASVVVLVVGGAVTVVAYRLMVRIGRLPQEERVLR